MNEQSGRQQIFQRVLAVASFTLLVALDFWSPPMPLLAGYVLTLSLAGAVLSRWAGWSMCGVAVAAGVLRPLMESGTAVAAVVGLNRAVVFGVTVFLVQRLAASRSQEHRLSRQDPLTGLANRRRFLERLEAELNRARRSGRPLTLVFLDCDRFKAINDSFGHLAGDRVLKTAAATLGESIRSYDLAARWGGDEFLLLLPETDEQAAKAVVERVDRQLQAVVQSRGWDLSVSMGVLTAAQPRESAEELIARADAAMYRAKQESRHAVFESLPADLKALAG